MKTIEYRVGQTGYEIDVIEHGSVIETYNAGNHRNESQAYVPVDSSNAFSPAKLREFAKSTAQEMAGEHGCDSSLVTEGEELEI